MADTVSKLISRAEFLSFMNISKDAATQNFELMGEGFTELAEEKNPKEYSRQYVHEKTERTDVVGYATSISYSIDAYSNNNVIARISEVHDKELIGTDAQVDIVNVNTFEGTQGAYKAYKRRYAIIPSSKGSGVEALVYAGTFKAVGDIVPGTFDIETKKFTPESGQQA